MRAYRSFRRCLAKNRWLYLAVVGAVVIIAYVLWATLSIAHSSQAEHEANRERRISGRAFLYGTCLSINDGRRRQDEAWQAIAAPSLAMSRSDPDRHARTLESLALLREAFRPLDCDAALATLSPSEREQARSRGEALPRGGLPPLSRIPPELLVPPPTSVPPG